MKKRMLKVLTLVVIASSANLSFSQEDSSEKIVDKKNSFGIGYDFGMPYEGIEINYKRYYSKVNFKSAIKTSSNNTYWSNQVYEITLPDSNGNFIGLSSYPNSTKLIQLRLGIEKKLKFENIELMFGVDMITGFLNGFFKQSIDEYTSNKSYELIGTDEVFYSSKPENKLNEKITENKKLLLGASLNFGVNFNVTDRFFINVILLNNLIIQNELNRTESIVNENYKDYFLNIKSTKHTEFSSRISVSLNYKF